MARPPIQLPSHVRAEIKARTARGESAKTIHAAMSGRFDMPSVPTLARLQVPMRTEAPPEHDPVAEVPDEIPETTPIEDLNRWIKRLEQGMCLAEQNGNLGAMASIAAKVAMLTSLRHKLTPIPKADPNEDVDFIKLANVGEERLLRLVKSLYATE